MKRRKALLSVWNKSGIDDFARDLVELGFDIISSGGTANAVAKAGVPVTDVAEITGQRPILEHRVATLHPHIHGGLLATEKMVPELTKLDYPWIDLVCVDLYPLEAEIATPGATRESVIDKTDIGGPTMLSSAAKGRRIVICDPADRPRVVAWLKEGEPDRENFITALCAKADGVIAGYRLASARYHSVGEIDGMVGTRVAECKYGENAWQTPAGLYSTGSDDPLALDKFRLVEGTAPSFNNWCDIDRMLQTATHMAAAFDDLDIDRKLALAVKHGNPCGAAYGSSAENVIARTVEGDRRAIFGGLLMTTFPIDEALAERILTHAMNNGQRRLLDGIIAPAFTDGAVEALRRKGDRCRFLVNQALEGLSKRNLDRGPRLRSVRGGFLKQPNYTFVPNWHELKIQPFDVLDVPLAWAIGSTSNSNTITLTKGGMLIGNGVGQQDRVGGCELALKRARDAGHDPQGAAAYSDSFFPFPDGPQVLCDAGIRAIFATSGSRNDHLTRDICEKAGVRLYLLPDAEARGFFGH